MPTSEKCGGYDPENLDAKGPTDAMSMTNAAFSAQDWFKALCEKAGLKEATAAQASKYRRGFGIAKATEQGKDPSSLKEKASAEEQSDAQRIQGAFKGGNIMDYGPYSQYNHEPSPHPKTKMLPPAFQKRQI
jgi:hypothetical protein